MRKIDVETERGTLLNGVLFDSPQKADTVVIAITGIHENFYSNPFYYNIGDTLSENGIDFIYAQTNDAFGEIHTFNVKTNTPEIMGWVECIANTAYQWLFTSTLNNVHVEAYGDFSQVEQITHTGAMIIGTYGRFTYGDPAGFLSNINDHMPTRNGRE